MVVGADVTGCGTKAQYPPTGQAVQSEEDVDPVLLVIIPTPQKAQLDKPVTFE